MSKASSSSSIETIIKNIRKLEANKNCFECGERGPQYCDLEHSTLVCTRCSGMLRELQIRIKSLTMATFTAEEAEALQKGGNEVAEKIWLAKYREGKDMRRPRPNDNDERSMKEFLREKYIKKKWYSKKPIAKKAASESEEDEDEDDDDKASTPPPPKPPKPPKPARKKKQSESEEEEDSAKEQFDNSDDDDDEDNAARGTRKAPIAKAKQPVQVTLKKLTIKSAATTTSNNAKTNTESDLLGFGSPSFVNNGGSSQQQGKSNNNDEESSFGFSPQFKSNAMDTVVNNLDDSFFTNPSFGATKTGNNASLPQQQPSPMNSKKPSFEEICSALAQDADLAQRVFGFIVAKYPAAMKQQQQPTSQAIGGNNNNLLMTMNATPMYMDMNNQPKQQGFSNQPSNNNMNGSNNSDPFAGLF